MDTTFDPKGLNLGEASGRSRVDLLRSLGEGDGQWKSLRIHLLVSTVVLAFGMAVAGLNFWGLATGHMPDDWTASGMMVLALLGLVMAAMGLLSFLGPAVRQAATWMAQARAIRSTQQEVLGGLAAVDAVTMASLAIARVAAHGRVVNASGHIANLMTCVRDRLFLTSYGIAPRETRAYAFRELNSQTRSTNLDELMGLSETIRLVETLRDLPDAERTALAASIGVGAPMADEETAKKDFDVQLAVTVSLMKSMNTDER